MLKRITILIPESLHKQFKKRLIDDGMSQQGFIEGAIKKYIGDGKDGKRHDGGRWGKWQS